MKRNYKNFIIVITYLMLLRVVLSVTTSISFFNFGLVFDLILIMFWVGLIGYVLRNTKYQKAIFIIIIFISSVLIVTDSIYFDYFEVLTSRSSIGGISRLAEGNTLEYDLDIPLAAFIVTPFFILASYLIIANKKRDVFLTKDFGILSLVFLLQVALFLTWGSYNFDSRTDYYRSEAYLFETMYDRNLFSEKYGYYNFHILDFTRFNEVIDEDEVYAEIDAYFADKESHDTNDYSDLYAGYNVISIIGETLETRFIDPVLTPNLYMMLNDGYSFDNYYTTVFQQGATCNSEFMSLTGYSAIPSNDWINNVCDSYSENTYTYALPNQLESIGYETYYFHSGYEWFYNRETITPQYGFSTSKFQEDIFDLGYDDFQDRHDTEMLYFFDEFVNYDELFYIDLLTYSMHGAYNQEEFGVHYGRVEEAYPNTELDPEVINYMAKLVEFDNMLGLIIEELTIHGQMDNTLFVIFPDHFPYMMDSEVYHDFIDLEIGTNEYMKQELIIYATNMTGEVISMTGSTMDITPTILNLIDSSLDFSYYVGLDLMSNQDNYVLFSDLTISDGTNYLSLNEEYDVNDSNIAILDGMFEQKIRELELQKKLLVIDYFKMLDENDE